MTNISAAIRRSIRSAVRWYVESCSHLDPAAVLGMYGTVMVADVSAVAGGAGRSPGASAKPSGHHRREHTERPLTHPRAALHSARIINQGPSGARAERSDIDAATARIPL